MGTKNLRIFLLLIFLSGSYQTFAQLEEVPLLHYKEVGATFRSQKKTQTINPVTLPFFDDFSGYTGRPDTTKWINSENVRISAGLGVRPPTVNVATLDGTRENGFPYSAEPNAKGAGDSLISQPVKLLNLTEAQKTTTFLSFFWQIKGNGEMADFDNGDSLRLQFKDNTGKWVTVWPRPSDNLVFSQLRVDSFYQSIVKVNAPFFHDEFQFRFKVYGNLTGPYDNWNLDYIYLNSGRSSSDLTYFDRALTSLPSPLFNAYTAVPITQFLQSPAAYTGNTSVDFYNLDAPNRFQGVTFSVKLFDRATNALITTLNTNTPTTPSPTFGTDRIRLQSQPFDATTLVNYVDANYQEQDTLNLRTEFSIISGETFLINREETVPGDTVFYPKVDLRTNDTTNSVFTLGNFFAYDDGTAEFGGRIATRSGQLAYEFSVAAADTISHVDIYFPAINGNPAGRSIDLFVWQNIKEGNVEVLRRQPIVIQESEEVNQFMRYTFDSPVRVTGTFYIGWQQNTDQELNIGLDKNTDTGERIFFNTRGNWEQNRQVKGSLMLRPVFENVPVTVGIPEPEITEQQFQLYPNPGDGKYFISGKISAVQVFDMVGREISHTLTATGADLFMLEIDKKMVGLYIVRMKVGNSNVTTKLVLH